MNPVAVTGMMGFRSPFLRTFGDCFLKFLSSKPGLFCLLFLFFQYPPLIYFGFCLWLDNRSFLQVPGDSRLFIFTMRKLKLIGNSMFVGGVCHLTGFPGQRYDFKAV